MNYVINAVKNKFFYSPDRKQIGKNISWLFVAEVGSRILRGILTILAARMLGASMFGIFTYTLALGGIITFFEDAGIGMFATREISKTKENSHLIFESSFNLKIILIGISLIVFFIVSPFLSIGSESFLLIIGVSIILFTDSLSGFFIAVLRAEEQMKKESHIKTITAICVCIFGLLFISMNPTATNLAFGYALGGIIGSIIALVYINKYFIGYSFLKINKNYLKKIFKTSWPYTIILLSSLMIMNIDTVFLGRLTDTKTVGEYNAANRFIQLAYIIPQLITVAVFPKITRYKENIEGIKKIFKKMNIALLLLAIVAIGVSFLLAPFVITLLFGAEYTKAIPIFLILSLGFIPVFLGQVFNTFIFCFDNQNKFIIINIIGFMVNIILNLILIPIYGALGAATATVISLVIINGYTGIKVHRYLKTL